MARIQTARKGKVAYVAADAEHATSSKMDIEPSPAATDESNTKANTSDADQQAVAYSGLADHKKRSNRAPTVKDIMVDPITQLASDHWATKPKVWKKSILSALFCNLLWFY